MKNKISFIIGVIASALLMIHCSVIFGIEDVNYIKDVEQAAFEGHERAQYTLGVYYYDGTGVLQSYEKAVKWFEKAALQIFLKPNIILACVIAMAQV